MKVGTVEVSDILKLKMEINLLSISKYRSGRNNNGNQKKDGFEDEGLKVTDG